MIKGLYTREEVRKLDKIAIENYNIPGISLMERAGKVAFEALKSKWPLAKNLLFFCGIGNNGGDGYVLARLAIEQGYEVIVYQLGDINKLKGDALLAYSRAIDSGIMPRVWEQRAIQHIDCAKKTLSNSKLVADAMTTTGNGITTTVGKEMSTTTVHNSKLVADVIVDAICGTGLNAPLTGQCLEAIRIINNAKIPVLSIDIPTGLNANTGIALGDAICSTLTTTFIGEKQGMYTGKARDHCGEILFSSLGVPMEIYNQVKPEVVKLYFDDVQHKLPSRKASSHKGDFGRVLVIGGAPGMGGAVCMAAEAALRIGAGLVYVITHPAHASYITMARPELICFGVDDNISAVLEQILVKETVIVLGPGLGQLDWSRKIFQEILTLNSRLKSPILIDADGLNLLSAIPKAKFTNCILTPHSGEAAKLLGISVQEVEQNRFQALAGLYKKFTNTLVLKGAGTLVTYQDKIGVCCAGNASMATAGMGDLLAGIIAGLLAQKLSCEDAAVCGVCLHATVGDLVSERGKYGIIATELLAKLSRVYQRQ